MAEVARRKMAIQSRWRGIITMTEAQKIITR
jgi:hypothetical protein